MNERELEEKISRRSSDVLTRWASMVGPVLGVAFGFGVAKATLDGTVANNKQRITELELRISAVEKQMGDRDGVYSVGLAKVNEQVLSINRRMERMEDLLQQTFYKVSTNTKDSRK